MTHAVTTVIVRPLAAGWGANIRYEPATERNGATKDEAVANLFRAYPDRCAGPVEVLEAFEGLYFQYDYRPPGAGAPSVAEQLDAHARALGFHPGKRCPQCGASMIHTRLKGYVCQGRC